MNENLSTLEYTSQQFELLDQEVVKLAERRTPRFLLHYLIAHPFDTAIAENKVPTNVQFGNASVELEIFMDWVINGDSPLSDTRIREDIEDMGNVDGKTAKYANMIIDACVEKANVRLAVLRDIGTLRKMQQSASATQAQETGAIDESDQDVNRD
jgi:hypothetical protein